MIRTHCTPRICFLAATALGLAAAACEAGGRAPALDGRPDSLVFDALVVGRMSPARVVEWSNAGADTVVLSDMFVTGPAAADFVLAEDLCDGATLAPGESCSAVVLFGPREAGPRKAMIAAEREPGSGAMVVLLGEGIADTMVAVEPAGLVRAVPETLDFGEQPLGAAGGPLGVRLVNRRPGPVQFAVRLRGGQRPGFRIALDRCSNEILDSGRACTVQVLFVPAAEGFLSGELILRDLNGPTDQSVPILGIGIPAAPAVGDARASAPIASLFLSVSPRALEFGVQEPGSSSAARVVQIKNGGAANVAFRSLRVAGSDAGSFRIAQNDCSGGLVPTRTCSLEIVFEPAAPGTRTARIEAVTISGLEPALVLLSGTGGSR